MHTIHQHPAVQAWLPDMSLCSLHHQHQQHHHQRHHQHHHLTSSRMLHQRRPRASLQRKKQAAYDIICSVTAQLLQPT
jgi:hypothetical protein